MSERITLTLQLFQRFRFQLLKARPLLRIRYGSVSLLVFYGEFDGRHRKRALVKIIGE